MKKILFIVCIVQFISCGVYSQKECYSVYNDVLLELIGTERYHVPFVRIFEYDSITQKKLWNDFIYAENRPIDNRRLFLAIYDTLDIHSWDIEQVTDLLEKVSSNDSILISKLIEENTEKDKVDLTKMPVIGRYELYHATHGSKLGLRNFFKENENHYREVGIIRLSKVAYIDNYRTGCFYYEIIDPGGHGHPSKIVFVKKEKGKWKILKEVYLTNDNKAWRF